MGSIIEVKKAPVESNARVMETLETLIAPKKVSQCRAITTPAASKTNSVLDGSRNFFLRHTIQKRMSTLAISILYHTSGTASIVIRAPKTAVKPQMNTMM